MADLMPLALKVVLTILAVACIALYFRQYEEEIPQKAFYGYVPQAEELQTEVILSTVPNHMEDFPETFLWNNVDGVNFLTQSHAQHQPYHYCGACWIFGSLAVIDDRLNIQNLNGVAFSGAHQVMINCGPNFENGCGGGAANDAFRWIHENGLPETSCNNYLAKNNKCNALGRCQDCKPGGQCIEKPEGTYAVAVVDEYGSINPPKNANLRDPTVIALQVRRMKAEISQRGPIACGIICTDKMVAYQPLHPSSTEGSPYEPHVMTYNGYGNVCAESDDIMTCIDHVVEVVGWDVDNGVEHWLIRNSWGTWWGENGFFRVETGKMTLGIESGCDWAVPRVIGEHSELKAFAAEKALRK